MTTTGPEIETGVIHGRFQIVHNDHVDYIVAGKEHCRHLVVGITNPDPTMTRETPADPGRSRAEANPLTYYERHIMVREVLQEQGLNHTAYTIVPLPISIPGLYRYYVPLDAVFFLTIFDDWGRTKRSFFRELGLRTQVLWERPPHRKGISGTDVRTRIMQGAPWEHLVPASAAALIKKWGIRDRLKKAATEAHPERPS